VNQDRLNQFKVTVTVENKKYVNDPEGETIFRDLISNSKYSGIKSIRTAKTFTLLVESSSERDAIKSVQNMCEELRLYNPIVSDCTVSIKKEDQ